MDCFVFGRMFLGTLSQEKHIYICLTGEDLGFMAHPYSLAFWLNEDEADKLAFHLQSVLQDREQKKKK